MADPRFVPVPKERVHQGVARQLREAILQGHYRPGDRLPREQELVELFKVSRSAARQAVLQLQQEGLVRVRVGSGGGAFVAELDPQPVVRAFENLFALRELRLDDFLAAKRVLEPAISAEASERITEEQLSRLHDNVALTEQGVARGQQVLELSLEFHRIIGGAANPVLQVMLTTLIQLTQRVPDFQQPLSAEGWQVILDEHRAILEALERHSPQAVHSAMADHVCTIDRVFREEPARIRSDTAAS